MKVLLYFLFFSVCFSSYAQVGRNRSYFDKYGNLTYVDSAYYYRENTDSLNYYKSYYTKSRKLMFEGFILNANDSIDNNNIYHGMCKWYYQNGSIKEQKQYLNGRLNGLVKEFDDRGNLRAEKDYLDGRLVGNEYRQYNSLGNSRRVYFEDFTDDLSKWKQLNANGISKIKIGGNFLSAKKSDTSTTVIDYPLNPRKFLINVKQNINYISNSSTSGIVYGFKDWKNYNFFYISRLRIHVGTVENGILKGSVENVYSKDIKSSGWNSLTVSALNDTLYFYVNGKLQCFSNNISVFGDKLGFVSINGAGFYDDLFITNENEYEDISAFERYKEYIFFNNFFVKTQGTYNGLFLDNNGFFITPFITNGKVSRILVRCINGESNLYKEAFVKSESEVLGYSFIQINDTNFCKSEIEYTFNSLRHSYNVKNIYDYALDTTLVGNNKIAITPVDFNSFQYKLLNFESDLKKRKEINYSGSALFDDNGHFIGFVVSSSKDGTLKVITSHEVINFYEQYTRKKYQNIFLKDESKSIEKTIYKNYIIIKVI